MIKQINIPDIFDALKKQWRKAALFTIIGAAIGIVVAFSIPKEYTCSIVLVPEGSKQGGSTNSLGGMAAMMGMNLSSSSQDGINEKIYPQIVSSSLFLHGFRNAKVHYQDVDMTLFQYLTEEQEQPWWNYIFALPAKALSLFSSKDNSDNKEYNFKTPAMQDVNFELALKERIGVDLDKKSGLLSATIKMQNPKIAATVADSLILALQYYIKEYKTSKSKANLENSIEMFNKAKEAYHQSDLAYAQALDKNKNLISQTAIIKLDRLENEKNLAFSVYQQLASQVEMNKIKLQEETPIITVLEPARVPVQATSPNKKLIVIAFGFLGAALICLKVIFKAVF